LSARADNLQPAIPLAGAIDHAPISEKPSAITRRKIGSPLSMRFVS
jgi:hypothetical protein